LAAAKIVVFGAGDTQGTARFVTSAASDAKPERLLLGRCIKIQEFSAL
jgi:hypothetical protein